MASNKKLHIVLVEDDFDQSEHFLGELERTLNPVNIELISCEAEFLDKYEKRPPIMPDVFVIDLMLEWRQPWVQSRRKLPTSILYQDEAALRCIEAVRSYDRDTPAILWSITSKEIPLTTLAALNAKYLRKEKAIQGALIKLIQDWIY